MKFGLVAHIIASAAAVCAYNIPQARKHRKQQEQAAAEADDETAATSAKTMSAVTVEHDIVLLTPTDTRPNGQQGEFEPADDNLGRGHGDPISHPPPI